MFTGDDDHVNVGWYANHNFELAHLGLTVHVYACLQKISIHSKIDFQFLHKSPKIITVCCCI